MKKNLAKAFDLHNSNFYFLTLIADNSHLVPEHLLKVLLAIAKYAPNSYPRMKTIQEMTGKSKRAVIYNIKELEKIGLIEVKRNHRKSNKYTISLGATAIAPSENLGCNLEQVRVQPRVTLGATAIAPQHINNILKEHIDHDDVINDCVKNAVEEGIDPDMVSPDTRKLWMNNEINKKLLSND